MTVSIRRENADRIVPVDETLFLLTARESVEPCDGARTHRLLDRSAPDRCAAADDAACP